MSDKQFHSDVDVERVDGHQDDRLPMTKASDVAQLNHDPVVRQLSTYIVGLLITSENFKASRKDRALYSRDQMGSGRSWDPHISFPLRYRQHDSRRRSARHHQDLPW